MKSSDERKLKLYKHNKKVVIIHCRDGRKSGAGWDDKGVVKTSSIWNPQWILRNFQWVKQMMIVLNRRQMMYFWWWRRCDRSMTAVDDDSMSWVYWQLSCEMTGTGVETDVDRLFMFVRLELRRGTLFWNFDWQQVEKWALACKIVLLRLLFD